MDFFPSGRVGVILKTTPPTGDSTPDEFEVHVVTRTNANGFRIDF